MKMYVTLAAHLSNTKAEALVAALSKKYNLTTQACNMGVEDGYYEVRYEPDKCATNHFVIEAYAAGWMDSEQPFTGDSMKIDCVVTREELNAVAAHIAERVQGKGLMREAIDAVVTLTRNERLKTGLERARWLLVNEGLDYWQAFLQSGVFPQDFCAALKRGEEYGNIYGPLMAYARQQ